MENIRAESEFAMQITDGFTCEDDYKKENLAAHHGTLLHNTQAEDLLALRPRSTEYLDNPLAPEILRQVEYYFSDENLATDKFLLKEIGGNLNKAIRISVIHGFQKMVIYPYAAVVSTLKQSHQLVVEGEVGKETVKRRIAVDIASEIKKKKKKKKSKSKIAKYGTGYEDFYAEPPITPAEFADEREDYHYSRSFNERIETCIQRYRAKRHMSSLRASAFDKYLTCGGVQTGVKAFGGADQQGFEEMNASEIRETMARDNITSGVAGRNHRYYDPARAEHWSVDFTAVAKTFLAPLSFGTSDQTIIKTYCSLVENFLNYVLSHSVCPEYTHDILAARKVCGLAEKELWATHEVSVLLPGSFNTAASVCYGGNAFQGITIDVEWNDGFEQETRTAAALLEDAETRVIMGIGSCGDKSQVRAMQECDCQPTLLSSERRAFEVIGICFGNQASADELMAKQDPSAAIGKIEAIGTATVKSWLNPMAEPEDLTEEEEEEAALRAAQAHLTLETLNLNPGSSAGLPVHDSIPAIDGTTNLPVSPPQISNNTTSLFFENSILEKLLIGMKFTCTLHTTSAGFSFIDNMEGVYPSFFTYLPNEMMNSWKTPVANPRPPPKVGDANIGEDDEFEDVDVLEKPVDVLGVKVTGLE